MSGFLILENCSGRRRGRGSHVIEFALVLPLVVMILFGTVDVAYWFELRHVLDVCVQEGALDGSVTAQGDDPDQVAIDTATATWAGMPVYGTPTFTVVRGGTPEDIELMGELTFNPLVGLYFAPETIRVTVVQRMEDQP